MKITYDPTSKRVVVAFRGRITVLPESYDTEAAGIAAAEAHCRHLGWNPQAQRGSEKKQFRSVF